MDRPIVYLGQNPLETDLLSTNRNTMTAIAKLAAAILGTSTLLNGFACTPTGPASMNVLVGAGEIYSLAALDATAYSSLAADTTHQILKQGIALDATTLAIAAPSTSGFSRNYLVQLAYSDLDTGPTVLPYYNSSNPAVAWSGPANSGISQNTARQGAVTISLKAGTAATTGTQTTPTPDAGYTGAWVVTVANGATSILSGNILQYPGAPFIQYTLPQLAPLSLLVASSNLTASKGHVKFNSALLNLTLQWVVGATDPADSSEPVQTFTWDVAFANAILGRPWVSTEISVSSGNVDSWYQVLSPSTSGVSVKRQTQPGGLYSGATTTPTVWAIGY